MVCLGSSRRIARPGRRARRRAAAPDRGPAKSVPRRERPATLVPRSSSALTICHSSGASRSPCRTRIFRSLERVHVPMSKKTLSGPSPTYSWRRWKAPSSNRSRRYRTAAQSAHGRSPVKDAGRGASGAPGPGATAGRSAGVAAVAVAAPSWAQLLARSRRRATQPHDALRFRSSIRMAPSPAEVEQPPPGPGAARPLTLHPGSLPRLHRPLGSEAEQGGRGGQRFSGRGRCGSGPCPSAGARSPRWPDPSGSAR